MLLGAIVFIAIFGATEASQFLFSELGLSKKEITQVQQLTSEVLGEKDNNVNLEDTGTYLITRIVDGDTIEIEGGQKVRYIGIDTPESKAPGKDVECFALEATEKNRQLVEGKQVRLEKDVNETDRYGRLLRYVYVGDVMVNEVLVSEGYAHAKSYPPDVKYQELFTQKEAEAREKEAGLWGEECI